MLRLSLVEGLHKPSSAGGNVIKALLIVFTIIFNTLHAADLGGSKGLRSPNKVGELSTQPKEDLQANPPSAHPLTPSLADQVGEFQGNRAPGILSIEEPRVSNTKIPGVFKVENDPVGRFKSGQMVIKNTEGHYVPCEKNCH